MLNKKALIQFIYTIQESHRINNTPESHRMGPHRNVWENGTICQYKEQADIIHTGVYTNLKFNQWCI